MSFTTSSGPSMGRGKFSASSVDNYHRKHYIWKDGSTYYGTNINSLTPYSSTTFTTVWNSVIANAVNKDVIDIAGNTTYYVTAAMSAIPSGVTVRSGGGTGTVDSVGATLDVTNGVDNQMLFAAGSADTTSRLLTANANKGAYTITLSGVANISTGSMILIASDAIWKSNVHSMTQGELKFVSSVNGLVVTLTEPIEDTYLTASGTPFVYVITPAQDVTIDGIRMVNTTFRNNIYSGIYFNYAYNCVVKNCYFYQLEGTAIAIFRSWNMNVNHCYAERSWQTGLGYVTAVSYSSRNVTVEYNSFKYCRHPTQVGGGSSPGIPRHVTFQYNYSVDAVDMGASETLETCHTAHHYDCHHCGEDINYLYNEATGWGNGIGNYGPYTGLYKGNYLHDLTPSPSYSAGGQGIIYFNPYGEGMVIEDNIIEDCVGSNSIGIELGTSSYDAINVTVQNNTITGSYIGVYAHNSTSDSGIDVGPGNHIHTCDSYGVLIAAGVGNMVTHDNDLTDAAPSIYTDNGGLGTNTHYNNTGYDV